MGRGFGPIGPGVSFFLLGGSAGGNVRIGGAGGGVSGTGATILEYSSGEGPESVFSWAGAGGGGSQFTTQVGLLTDSLSDTATIFYSYILLHSFKNLSRMLFINIKS